MLKFNDTLARAILNRLAADAPGEADEGAFFGAKVQLFQNDVTPSRNSVLGDFTEADFSGYAESAAVTWNAAITDDNGTSRIVGGTVQFTRGVGATSNTIYGYMVVDAAGTGLLWAERFSAPREMDEVGEGIPITPVFALGR